MYKLGVIGVGNMGGSILRGVLESGYISGEDIIVFDHHKENLKDLFEKNVNYSDSELDIIKNVEYLLLSVKPQSFKELSKKIKGKISEDTVLISIAVGISISQLEKYFGDLKFIRVMPNTPALVGEGMSSLTKNEKTSEEELEFAKGIFSSIGKVTVIDEKMIDVFSGLAGCMPAFVYMFIEAAADAGVKNGMKRKDSYDYVSQAVLGSAKMVRDTKIHPGELKDQVTSPGGTTIQGVVTLEDEGFRNAIIKAVDASINYKIDLD